MRIVAFNGSPRAERSATSMMVEAFLAGAQAASADTEQIYLARKTIGHCLGCFRCWLETPGRCVQSDEAAELLEKYSTAEVVVFATPLHNDNVSGLMKNFIDRLLPLGDPHFEKDEHGETRHVKGPQKDPRFVMIANCGFPEQSHFQVLRLLARRMARNYQTEFVGEIYRGAGPLLQDDAVKPLVDAYLELLRRAGAEVVTQGRITDETARQLEEPLIPAPNYADLYIANANAYMDGMLQTNTRT